MRLLTEMISESFIWGVGITRPAKGQERRAAVYITVGLVGSIAAVGVVFLLLLGRLGR